MNNIFLELQNEIAEKAADVNQYVEREGIDILTEVKGDLVSEMERRLQKLGIGITVFVPTFKLGATRDELLAALVFEVVENVTVNMGDGGLKVSALDLCAALVAIFHEWDPEKGNGFSEVLFDSVEMVESAWPGTIAYQATFHASAIRRDADEASLLQASEINN